MMKRIIILWSLVLFLIGGCASTKEVVIKDWAGIAEKPKWVIGEKWVYKVTDSKGDKRTNNIEYIGQENRQGILYHVFLRNEIAKRYFTEDFHWAFSLLKEKDDWRDYEYFKPPNKYFEFPLQVGKSWQYDLATTKITGDPPQPRTGKCVKERKVLDYVKVEINGKSFEAYKIEEKCQIHRTRQVLWYAPMVKNWVKRIWYNPDGSWWQEELTNYEIK